MQAVLLAARNWAKGRDIEEDKDVEEHTETKVPGQGTEEAGKKGEDSSKRVGRSTISPRVDQA